MRLIGMVAALAVVGAAGMASAQDAKMVNDQRVAGMKGVGGAFGGVVMRYVRGDIEYGPNVAEAGKRLDALAKSAPAWFTVAPTPDLNSAAKAEIWSNKADFDAKLAGFQTAAANLAAVIDSGDKARITAAAQAVGATCGTCHTPYRTQR
jgi:cytochrome c556